MYPPDLLESHVAAAFLQVLLSKHCETENSEVLRNNLACHV